MAEDWDRRGYAVVGVVRSGRSRLSPKRLSDRMDEAKDTLRGMGGGRQGLMRGAAQVGDQGEEIEEE